MIRALGTLQISLEHSLVQVQLNPLNTDTEGNIEHVHIKRFMLTN